MIIKSDYRSPLYLRNGHIETIVPYYFRPLKEVPYKRERIETSDQDFLDLDWHTDDRKKLCIISHGMEGSSQSPYIQGLTPHLTKQGFDILAWNFRGCSGETNKKLKMYHSGASFDLRDVINHVFKTTSYQEVSLIGFSMGGNITLKYLGEEGEEIDSRIQKAMAISTPVYLTDCAKALSSGMGKIYTKSFLLKIVRKLAEKEKIFSDYNPDLKSIKKIWNFEAFDNAVTAPINGFLNAQDYWEKSSSLYFLPKIMTKTLVLNALNDPFLQGKCFPFDELRNHPFVDLEAPSNGGHVGFLENGLKNTWLERRVCQFLADN